MFFLLPRSRGRFEIFYKHIAIRSKIYFVHNTPSYLRCLLNINCIPYINLFTVVGIGRNYLELFVEKCKDFKMGLFLQTALILADLHCPVQNSFRICALRDKIYLLQHFNTGFSCLFTKERKTCTSFYACTANGEEQVHSHEQIHSILWGTLGLAMHLHPP